MRRVAATGCSNKSPRVTCEIIVAATEFCRCDLSHKFKLVWIRATYRSNKLSTSDLSQQQCRRGAICRIVCLGLKTILIQSFPLLVSNKIKMISKVHLCACASKQSLLHIYLNSVNLYCNRGKTHSSLWLSCCKHCTFGSLYGCCLPISSLLNEFIVFNLQKVLFQLSFALIKSFMCFVFRD